MENLYLPEELKRMLEGQTYTMDDIGMSESQVLIFEDKVLKIRPQTEETESECVMLTWLDGKLPVPKLLFHACENGIDYLLMSKIHGKMSCDEAYMENPRELVSLLAKALKLLWQVDISDCPMTWDVKRKLPITEQNVTMGLVDMDNVEPETFGENGFKNPQELLEWLIANQPKEEQTLVHGDFCLPNIFLKDNEVAGYIDIGRMGIGDKWQDIALCYRSLKHNFGGKYTQKIYEDFNPDILFEELGIEPDWEKINYFILLDELW